ncbi:MAG TPA: polysaccharide deacetylase family protein [Chitinophagaceae bacterium]|nr:polysaccharide deacetylase family protein [Chitinophagaceae bacterium]
MKLLAVNFHYFREETYASGIYPVSKASLIRQIDALAKEYQFVSQSDILRLMQQDKPDDKSYCVITIDDGLKEQMDAYCLLKQHGVPSILYVPSYPIQAQRVLDVHKLHYVRTQMKDADLYELLDTHFQLSTHAFDDAALANQYRYDEPLSRKVKYFLNFVLTDEQKKQAIDLLFDALVRDEAAFARNLYMSEADIRYLSDENALGSHGHRHLPLATLTAQEAQVDILTSLQYFEQLCGKPVPSFSYPYGGKDAVNEQLPNLFQSSSVQFAFTMWRGINVQEIKQQPYLLRRIDTNDAPGGKNNSTEFSLHTHA